MWFVVNVGTFLLFQVIAAIIFKWGTLAPGRYWWGFVLGNIFGMTSTLMMINTYKALSPAAALAVCYGGAFIINQIGLLLVYKQAVSLVGWCAIILIFSGIILFAFSATTIK